MTEQSWRVAGQQFTFDDAYYQAVSSARSLKWVSELPLFEGSKLSDQAALTDDVRFMGFLGKAYEVKLLIDALEGAGIRKTFRSSLDIGSGAALHARLLKVLGKVKDARAIDVYYGLNHCSEKRFAAYARKMTLCHWAFDIFRKCPQALQTCHPFLKKIKQKWPFGSEAFGYYPKQGLKKWLTWPRKTLDQYYVGDVFEHARQYDLVTSFMALDYFDFDQISAKVSKLLHDDGIFAFIVSYWWYPVNNTLLYGRFPYLLQQLNTAEVMAYYQACHPELCLEGIERRLAYSDQRRLTIADYEAIGMKHGLVPKLALRLHPDHEHNDRAVIGPLQIDRMKAYALSRVLENAQKTNPSVTLSDLLTSHVLMVFQKQKCQ